MHYEPVKSSSTQAHHQMLARGAHWASLSVLMLGLVPGPDRSFGAATDDWSLLTPNPSTMPIAYGVYGNGTYVFIAGEQYGGQIITTPDLTSWNIDFLADQLSWNSWRSIVFDGNQFVIAGEAGAILTSPDATEWTPRSSGTSLAFLAVTHGNGRLVAVGEDGVTATSTDGVNWTPGDIGDDNWYWSVAHGNNVFVAVSGFRTIGTSPDGVNWTLQDLPAGTPEGWLYDVTWTGTEFVAVGGRNEGGGLILTSPNGVDWTNVTDPDLGFDGWLNGTVFDGTTHFAVGTVDNLASAVMTSTYLVNWDFAQTAVCPNFFGVIHENGQTIAVGDYGVVATLEGPNAWQRRGSEQLRATQPLDIAFADGEFRLVGLFGLAARSTDGMNWIEQNTASSGYIEGVAYGNGKWVAANRSNEAVPILYESAGAWVPATVPVSVTAAGGIAFGAGKFVALANSGPDPFIISSDGENWSGVSTPGFSSYNEIVFDGGLFLAWRNAPEILNTTETLRIATSADGLNWEEKDTGMVGSRAEGAEFANGRWVLVGRNVNQGAPGDWHVMTSTDLETWSEENLSFGTATTRRGLLQDVTYADGQWVAVGARHLLWTAVDGPALNWEATFTSGMGNNSNDRFLKVISADDSFVVMGVSRDWNAFGAGIVRVTEVYQSGAFGVSNPPSLGIIKGPGQDQVQLQIEATIGVSYDILFHPTLPVQEWQLLDTVTPAAAVEPYDYTIPGGQDSGIFLLRESP
jgi:hypothetical protein